MEKGYIVCLANAVKYAMYYGTLEVHRFKQRPSGLGMLGESISPILYYRDLLVKIYTSIRYLKPKSCILSRFTEQRQAQE